MPHTPTNRSQSVPCLYWCCTATRPMPAGRMRRLLTSRTRRRRAEERIFASGMIQVVGVRRTAAGERFVAFHFLFFLSASARLSSQVSKVLSQRSWHALNLFWFFSTMWQACRHSPCLRIRLSPVRRRGHCIGSARACGANAPRLEEAATTKPKRMSNLRIQNDPPSGSPGEPPIIRLR